MLQFAQSIGVHWYPLVSIGIHWYALVSIGVHVSNCSKWNHVQQRHYLHPFANAPASNKQICLTGFILRRGFNKNNLSIVSQLKTQLAQMQTHT